jgi:hypothetical protein
MKNRTDHLTALLVDAVLYLGETRGTTELACILCGNGVPFDVALRVLTKPERRRRFALKPSKRTPTQSGSDHEAQNASESRDSN